jgi:hypothetical protein
MRLNRRTCPRWGPKLIHQKAGCGGVNPTSSLAIYHSRRQTKENIMAATDPPIPAIKPTDPVCFYCSRRKDAVDPWEFQILDIDHLKSGAGLGCQTCDLRYRAVSCHHSDPGQRVIFQADPKRLTFDRRRFFEIFKLPRECVCIFRTYSKNEFAMGLLLTTSTELRY